MSGKKVLFLIVLFCISVGLNASTIHWITFVNTENPNVGQASKNSKDYLYSRVINTVDAELSQFGYNYKIYHYDSSYFTPQNCHNIIKELQCDTTDMIVFYYIGNGMNISSDANQAKYPTLFIDDDIKNGIPLSWIHQSLKEKNARLTLTFAVSCNKNIGVRVETEIAEVSIPSAHNYNETYLSSQQMSGIANAFLGYKGDMVVCSASPEQDSWAVQTPFGSMDVFTYVFVSTFEGAIFDKSFTWPKFLTKLSETTTEVTKDMPTQGIQTPIYDYDLKLIRENDR